MQRINFCTCLFLRNFLLEKGEKKFMKYTVDKNKFAKLLAERPHLLKTISGLNEAVLLDLFQTEPLTRKIYEAIPEDLRTLEVTRLYMRVLKDDNSYYYHFNIDFIPKLVLAQLTSRDRKKLLKVSDFVTYLPDVTSEEWNEALSHNFEEYAKIPADSWTRDMVKTMVSKSDFTSYSLNDEKDVVDSLAHLFDPDFALQIAQVKVEALTVIPKNFITRDVLYAALSLLPADERFELGSLSGSGSIPKAAWDLDTADLAIKAEAENIKFIPSKYLTSVQKVCVASHGVFHKSMLDDYQAIVTYIARASFSEMPEVLTEALKSKNLGQVYLDALQVEEASIYHIRDNMKALGYTITPKDVLEGLKINPEGIRLIPKSEQTDEMIDALVTAAADKIDSIANYIDLRRIKPTHACLLMGCTSSLILRTVAGISHGNRRVRHSSAAVDISLPAVPAGCGVEITMTPGDFARIQNKLKPLSVMTD